jgi:hypothetical protein
MTYSNLEVMDRLRRVAARMHEGAPDEADWRFEALTEPTFKVEPTPRVVFWIASGEPVDQAQLESGVPAAEVAVFERKPQLDEIVAALRTHPYWRDQPH